MSSFLQYHAEILTDIPLSWSAHTLQYKLKLFKILINCIDWITKQKWSDERRQTKIWEVIWEITMDTHRSSVRKQRVSVSVFASQTKTSKYEQKLKDDSSISDQTFLLFFFLPFTHWLNSKLNLWSQQNFQIWKVVLEFFLGGVRGSL